VGRRSEAVAEPHHALVARQAVLIVRIAIFAADREVTANGPLDTGAGADAVEIDAGAGERGARIGIARLRVDQRVLADDDAGAQTGIEVAIGRDAAVGNGRIRSLELDAEHRIVLADVVAAGDAEGDA